MSDSKAHVRWRAADAARREAFTMASELDAYADHFSDIEKERMWRVIRLLRLLAKMK